MDFDTQFLIVLQRNADIDKEWVYENILSSNPNILNKMIMWSTEKLVAEW